MDAYNLKVNKMNTLIQDVVITKTTVIMANTIHPNWSGELFILTCDKKPGQFYGAAHQWNKHLKGNTSTTIPMHVTYNYSRGVWWMGPANTVKEDKGLPVQNGVCN